MRQCLIDFFFRCAFFAFFDCSARESQHSECSFYPVIIRSTGRLSKDSKKGVRHTWRMRNCVKCSRDDSSQHLFFPWFREGGEKMCTKKNKIYWSGASSQPRGAHVTFSYARIKTANSSWCVLMYCEKHSDTKEKRQLEQNKTKQNYSSYRKVLLRISTWIFCPTCFLYRRKTVHPIPLALFVFVFVCPSRFSHPFHSVSESE